VFSRITVAVLGLEYSGPCPDARQALTTHFGWCQTDAIRRNTRTNKKSQMQPKASPRWQRKVKNLPALYYGKFHALKKNINLLNPEKVTAFIGPSSGCGKSTLLRISTACMS
jgi:ABC-type transport system involved in cytochrome bd biosynthesis fused ATPase/permease subunit